MEYRNLGSSGLKISELSFGSWVTFVNQLGQKQALECMAFAYEQGVNFFDNAEAYASGDSEILMGKVLNKLNWTRDTYIVSSKVFWGGELPTQRGLSKKHIHDACNAALKRLQVDYLDLFFCHRPDSDTPISETVYAMNDLIHQGKILYWGTSEWSAEEIKESFKCAKKFNLRGPTMEQPQYNLLFRDRFEKEYKDITIIGGESGDIDHLFGNLLSLSHFHTNESIEWKQSNQNIIFPNSESIDVETNKIFSLIPLSKLEKVSITGAKWNIENENIDFGSSRTLRNVTHGTELKIKVESGSYCLVFNN